MINIDKYVINMDAHKTARLLTWNNIQKVTRNRTKNLGIDEKEYTSKMSHQYSAIFPSAFRRFKMLLNNTAQPDSNELLFFSKYLQCSIDELVEHPQWEQ